MASVYPMFFQITYDLVEYDVEQTSNDTVKVKNFYGTVGLDLIKRRNGWNEPSGNFDGACNVWVDTDEITLKFTQEFLTEHNGDVQTATVDALDAIGTNYDSVGWEFLTNPTDESKTNENTIVGGHFSITENGDLMIGSAGMDNETHERMDEFQGTDDEFLWAFYETELTNGYNLVPPQHKGLTEAPMIADDVIDDQTDMNSVLIWYFEPYQVKSLRQEILDKGHAILTKAPVGMHEKKNSLTDVLKTQICKIAEELGKKLSDEDEDAIVQAVGDYAKSQNRTKLDVDDIKSVVKSHLGLDEPVSEGIKYHIEHGLGLFESIYRPGSKAWLDLVNEVRSLNTQGQIQLTDNDKWLLTTDVGERALYEGTEVPLDFPMIYEAEYKGGPNGHSRGRDRLAIPDGRLPSSKTGNRFHTGRRVPQNNKGHWRFDRTSSKAQIQTNMNNKYQKKLFINEVRIPNGYFIVTNTFMMPHLNEWDLVFSKGQIVNIDTTNKKILFWDTFSENWITKDITYLQMMEQDKYALFKANTKRIDAASLPKDVKASTDGPTEFMTSINNVKRKATIMGISGDTKVKVATLESATAVTTLISNWKYFAAEFNEYCSGDGKDRYLNPMEIWKALNVEVAAKFSADGAYPQCVLVPYKKYCVPGTNIPCDGDCIFYLVEPSKTPTYEYMSTVS